jgi:ACS family tartrate transporter-like MFS transporter
MTNCIIAGRARVGGSSRSRRVPMADSPQTVPAASHALSAAGLEERVVAKVVRRLVPFMFICYVVAYLDRVNVGFAAGSMQHDLGLSDAVYGFGAGLFFLGYFVFEIPSNLILARVGARVWIARIMLVWGLVSMAMIFVVGPHSFYALRLLLGLAEAGFFPGMVLFLTYWVPSRHRAKTNALFMMAAPVAMVVGGPLSAELLKLSDLAGLRGWQWLFLVEGLPAVALGVLAPRFLTDRPEKATWLDSAERSWLERTLAEERARKAAAGRTDAVHGLFEPRVWLLCLIFFLNTCVTYGVFLWLPRILEDASGLKGFRLGALTALPFLAALAGMVLIGAHSDRTGERRWHVASCALTAATGLILAVTFRDNVALLVLSLTLCQVGQRSITSVFWTIPPALLGGAAAAAGIALINSIGNLGGFLGPSLVGWLKTGPNYTAGLLALAAAMVLLAGLVLLLRLPPSASAAAAAGRKSG